MKLTQNALALLASLLFLSAAAAQDAVVQSPKEEAKAAREREKKLQEEERARALLNKKPVIYSGFLVEAAHARNKKSFFSLRSPRDPKNDYRNLSFEERSNRPKGFVLFRLEF